MPNSQPSPAQAAEELLRRRNARRGMLDFLQYVWWMPQPLKVGTHTREICKALDEAVEAFERGESSYLKVAVPFRHGKSDIVSRAFPAYFLGRMRERQPDIIQTGYGADLVQGFSVDVKRILRSHAYQRLFPGVLPERGRDRQDEWSVEGSAGRVVAVGLGGGMTGKGAVCAVLDDYCKKREEAESETYRRKTWESFTNDLMTRLAPVHIVIVCATPWHVDDVNGRIDRNMEKDPDFPRFRSIRFPARNGDGSFLFEERMGANWYRTQYATLGTYAAAALLDCSPCVRDGGLLKTAGVQIHDNPTGWPERKHGRVWDLASTAKQRQGDDPDWTCGALGCITHERDPATGAALPHLWVRDAVFCREEAPKRDALIRATALRDGPGVSVYVEAFGGYKDAFTTLKQALGGTHMVRQLRLPGDKAVKAAPLEAIFEAGNVHLLRGAWNAEWLKQHEEFTGRDGATHDDAVDTSAMLYHIDAAPKAMMAIPGMM